MAALPFPGGHRSPVCQLRRDSLSHRLFPCGFLERVEVEPARLSFLERIVDLRRLRFRRFGNSRAAVAHRAAHAVGEKFSAAPRRHLVALELDLSALAPARFVLELWFKALSSDLLSARQCPRGKSPSRRFPIRTRTSRFTS